MRKRIVAVLLAAVMCLFALTACDGGGSGSVTPAEPGSGTNTGSGSSSSSVAPLTVKILGASSYSKVSGYVDQFYSLEVTNPNSSKAARFTQVTVTLKNASGQVIKSDTNYIGVVAAGDTIRYSGNIMYQGEMADTIGVSLNTPGYGFDSNEALSAVYSDDLVVSNVSLVGSGNSRRITGEVTNRSSKSCSMVRVSSVLQTQGQCIGGDYCYVDNLAPGATQSFEINLYGLTADINNFAVYAASWS